MHSSVIERATIRKHQVARKRVRHVYPADMVAHLWAHKAQDSARNAGGNFYFTRDTIYSYGTHFPIAKHVSTKRGKAVLCTTRHHSVTTSGHTWTVLSACKHLTVFHVQHPTDTDHKGQFTEYRDRYLALARKYSRARSNKPWILGSLRDLVDEANRFAQFFGLRSRLSMPTDLSAMEAECRAVEKRERVRKQREEAKRQREYEARKADATTKLEEWASGGAIDRWAFGGYDLPIRLRINGDELQTSRGATVPLSHAVKAFRIIKRLHNRGQAYERNGHTVHLGHFALDAVDRQGNVRAGCHNVSWEEIERVATIAGVN
jgi:hypothetical protein